MSSPQRLPGFESVAGALICRECRVVLTVEDAPVGGAYTARLYEWDDGHWHVEVYDLDGLVNVADQDWDEDPIPRSYETAYEVAQAVAENDWFGES